MWAFAFTILILAAVLLRYLSKWFMQGFKGTHKPPVQPIEKSKDLQDKESPYSESIFAKAFEFFWDIAIILGTIYAIVAFIHWAWRHS